MTFSPSIPQQKDILSVSQGDLQTNFTQLNTQFGVNHIPFDDASGDKGKHKFVTFVEQAEDPESKVDEYVVFSKDDDGDTELYVRPENNQDTFQLTKDGEVYLGLSPYAAVNFSEDGTPQGTQLRVTTVNKISAGVYEIIWTPALPDNNYFVDIGGMTSSGTIFAPAIKADADYNNVATTTSVFVDFQGISGSISNLLRGTVMIWRAQ